MPPEGLEFHAILVVARLGRESGTVNGSVADRMPAGPMARNPMPNPSEFQPRDASLDPPNLDPKPDCRKGEGGADAACLTKTIRSVTNALKIRQSAPWVLAL